MVGDLRPDEIEAVLESELICRIGCHAGGRTYVVPVTYAYVDGAIYGHTAEGMKLAMMRQNPEVCVEVEQVESPSRWRSVIAWGRFEELSSAEEVRAMQALIDRYFASRAGKTARGPLGPHRPGATHPAGRLYRIRLTEKTGRFEEDAPPIAKAG